VLILFRRVLVMLCCFGGHGNLPGKGVLPKTIAYSPPLKLSGTIVRPS
jgi:hypothetical protein